MSRSHRKFPSRRKLGFEPLEARRVLATLWVDPNVAPTPTIFSTIGAAVAAAHGGDTVKVVAGEYAENVVVNKPLTIVGGQVRIAGEPAGPSQVSGNFGTAFELKANNITVKNFSILLSLTGIATSPMFSGYKILNNTFNNVTVGINLSTSSASTALATSITGNTFVGYGLAGQYGTLIDISSGGGLSNVGIGNNAFGALGEAFSIKIGDPNSTSASTNVRISNNQFNTEGPISVNKVTMAKIDDNTIVDPNADAIIASGLKNSEVVRNALRTSSTNLRQGIRMTTLVDFVCIGDKIQGNTIQGFYVGISLHFVQHMTVSANTIVNSGTEAIFDEDGMANTLSANVIDTVSGNGIFAGGQGTIISSNTVTRASGDGLHLQGASGATVSKNVLNNNQVNGIALANSQTTNLSGNTTSNNTKNGINLDTCAHVTVSGNTANLNAHDGIDVSGGSDNMLSSNTAKFNGEFGILLISTDRSTLTSNIASFNSDNGIHVSDADNASLTGNTANYNQGHGFSFDAKNSTCVSNTARGNSRNGFSFEEPDHFILSKNLAVNNGLYGINVNDGLNGMINGNKASSNGSSGFRISGDSNVIKANTANYNRENGFNLTELSNCTFSGNTATGNQASGISLNDSSHNVTLSANNATYNLENGIAVTQNSSGNTISGNTAFFNGALDGFDLFDATLGTGTAGTANTWAGNMASSRDPSGLQ